MLHLLSQHVTTYWQLWQEDLKAAITKVSHGETPVKRASPVVGVPRATRCGFGDVVMYIHMIRSWDGCCMLFP